MTVYKAAHSDLQPVRIQNNVRQLEADIFEHASSEVHPPNKPNYKTGDELGS